jgi:hypothetical protein
MPTVVVAVIMTVFLASAAQALPRGHAEGDACTEKFRDCLRGCGSPGSNPACERWCEEMVLGPCKGPGAAAIKPKGTKKLNISPGQ